MSLTVLIPWRPQPSRLAAFDAVAGWYRDNLGDVDIRPVDSVDSVFNLAQCRNVGVSSVANPEQVVVINDADTFPQLSPLLDAIAQAASSRRVHLPYTEYRWLGDVGTRQFLDGMAPDECDFELVRGACSGVYVTTPDTWWSHGGQDEGFRGWGFEDAAWNLAHHTLLGEAPRRHAGTVFALNHITAEREGEHYDANAHRMQQYRLAADNRTAMNHLVLNDWMATRARARPVA